MAHLDNKLSRYYLLFYSFSNTPSVDGSLLKEVNWGYVALLLDEGLKSMVFECCGLVGNGERVAIEVVSGLETFYRGDIDRRRGALNSIPTEMCRVPGIDGSWVQEFCTVDDGE
ncbi:hypothetical protein V6N11_064985 [Hibiscus sabdariffa]|uniref:Uncharacterized protein n=1 Tax=Hibiscus sabdariffa TaxID=183260 RepID=A0ABR2SJF3_9ROSI